MTSYSKPDTSQVTQKIIKVTVLSTIYSMMLF